VSDSDRSVPADEAGVVQAAAVGAVEAIMTGEPDALMEVANIPPIELTP
jgi:hypothetical protein